MRPKVFIRYNMKITDRIHAFSALGKKLKSLTEDELTPLIRRSSVENPWFTSESIRNAIEGVSYMLEKDKLTAWTDKYTLDPEVPKVVGIVMAGNIPLVGFHDLLCVLLSGHVAAIKLSSQDDVLPKKVINWLVGLEAGFNRMITFPDKLTNIDAVIATGSDNTARYFEYYFGKYPNIIRKNRTSVAILTGEESDDELKLLGKDVFDYFGLGCRNVSKIYIPKNFDLTYLLDLWEGFGEIIFHNKYRNNYDYHKSILLVNKETHLDTGFSLLKETEDLVSPTSVLYYERYDDLDLIKTKVNEQSDKIQCIISTGNIDQSIEFGKAQRPEPWDYADGVDTLAFLEKL